MKKIFVVICKSDNILYMNTQSETLFHSPLHEHVYRKFSDAIALSGIDAKVVRCSTYDIPSATAEINADIDDVVVFASLFAFFAKTEDIIASIRYVETELGYATLGSPRSLYAVFGTGKMLSNEIVSNPYDFICLIENCGASFKQKSFAEGEFASPSTKFEYLERVEKYRKDFLTSLSILGVKIDSFDGVVISPDSYLSRGVNVLCGSTISGSVIDEDCVIGPSSTIEKSKIAKDCIIKSSQISDSVIEQGVKVGPYSNIHSSTHILSQTEIGAFVDICNCDIGVMSVIRPHTSLIQSEIGSRVHIGSAVVTVNYDGKASMKCKIFDDAFIGSNVSLVAPVTVNLGAFIAAGSTITDDVPSGALAIAREYQSNHDGWARRRSKGNN